MPQKVADVTSIAQAQGLALRKAMMPMKNSLARPLLGIM